MGHLLCETFLCNRSCWGTWYVMSSFAIDHDDIVGIRYPNLKDTFIKKVLKSFPFSKRVSQHFLLQAVDFFGDTLGMVGSSLEEVLYFLRFQTRSYFLGFSYRHQVQNFFELIHQRHHIHGKGMPFLTLYLGFAISYPKHTQQGTELLFLQKFMMLSRTTLETFNFWKKVLACQNVSFRHQIPNPLSLLV